MYVGRSRLRFISITELYRVLKESGFTLPSDLEQQLYVFNKYYTVTRYPDAAGGLPSESVDEVEAKRALELAKRVVEYVKQYTGGGS